LHTISPFLMWVGHCNDRPGISNYRKLRIV
jgi:hypothetical protein